MTDSVCEVCWTYSWAPFDKEAHAEELDKAPNCRQIDGRWEICQMCQAIADLHNQYRKGLLKAIEIAENVKECTDNVEADGGHCAGMKWDIVEAIRSELKDDQT